MRVLFYYLLVLNLLYAGWEYARPSYKNVEVVALAGDLKTLELLNEVEDEVVATVNESALDKESETPEKDVEAIEPLVLSCYTLGPFKDEDIVRQVRESMAEDIDDIKVRTLEESERHRYWVYIPSLPGRKQAKEMARKLKSANLKDFYVVLSGKTKNSISLGHFRELEYANRRAKRVRELGFPASVEVIYKKYNIHWIDYRASKGDLEIESLINSHLSEGVSRLNRNCE